MAGTRTAPDATGAATSNLLSVHFIDDSGDVWSEAHIIPVAATAAQVEAYLDTLQAGSGASIYKFERGAVWGSDALADSGNAETDGSLLKSRSVFDSLNITLKHTTDPEKKNKVVRVPAPIAALFTSGTGFLSDNIDIESAELIGLLSAVVAMFGAGWAVAWGRFSEKGEINERQKL